MENMTYGLSLHVLKHVDVSLREKKNLTEFNLSFFFVILEALFD